MHIIAATFLLPVGVIVYTSVGGIKATFLTDYFHTFVILIIACYFSVKAYTIPEISSPSQLYNLVIAAGHEHPVLGNHDGSYMTMTSKGVSLHLTFQKPISLTIPAGNLIWHHPHPREFRPGHNGYGLLCESLQRRT